MRRFSVVVAVFLVSALAADADTLSVAIDAEFDHPPQIGMFRTRLSSVTRVAFTPEQSGGTTATFLQTPADCFGIISWVAAGKPSTEVGPAVMCLTNSAITEQDFNSWRGKKLDIDPRLTIALGPPEPDQTRRNISAVVAQLFLRGCDSPSFRRFGDLVFEKGSLAFTFWTDQLGNRQVNLSAAALLQKMSGDTWNAMRQGCDRGQTLPPTPFDGRSASLSGSSFRQPLDPSTLPGQISRLLGGIHSLAARGQLSAKAAEKLLGRLDKAIGSAQDARPEQAVDELQKFQDELTRLVDRGEIDAATAMTLAKLANGIEMILSGRVTLPLPPPDLTPGCSGQGAPCPDTVTPCAFTPWNVDASFSGAAPDGSAKNPFPSIISALAQATTQRLCGVTLQVAPGRYLGNLEISRHTRIIGRDSIIEGSVNNRGPHLLEMENVSLSWFRKEVANGVVVDHPCAITQMEHVAVVGYRGFGISQRDGVLRLRQAIVANTQAHADSLAYGTGVLLTCGVVAELSGVVLDSNESAALVIAGEGTDVRALNVRARDTRVHPSLAGSAAGVAMDWAGAVQIRDRARLSAAAFLISRSRLLGLVVDRGAEATLVLVSISDTRPATLSPPIEDGEGTVNASALRGGHLQMSYFTSTRAEFCGVLVTDRGELDLTEGSVTRSGIGACVGDPAYRLSRLKDAVIYADNVVDIECSGFPAPLPLP